MFLWLSLILFLHVQICVGYVVNPWSVWSFSMSFGLLICHWGFTIAVLTTEGGLTLLSCLLWVACSSCIVCLTLLNVLCQLFLLILYACLGIHIVLPPVLGRLCIFVTSSVQRCSWTGMMLIVWHLFYRIFSNHCHHLRISSLTGFPIFVICHKPECSNLELLFISNSVVPEYTSY